MVKNLTVDIVIGCVGLFATAVAWPIFSGVFSLMTAAVGVATG